MAAIPPGLRIEDSQAFEFDDNNVFSFNQVPGYDLIESGPRANVGAMAEALFPGGKVEAQVGQTYRLKRDPLFAAFSGNSGTSSDLVGSFSVKFPHLDITDRCDVDRGNGTVRRHEIYVTGSYARSSLQVSYVNLPPRSTALGLPSREEVNAQADLNVWRNWQVFAAAQRDLSNSQFLNTEYGLGYEDECLAISLAYRRKYTSDLILGVPPSTSVILRFSLKTGDTADPALQPVPAGCFRPDSSLVAHKPARRWGFSQAARFSLIAAGISVFCPQVRGEAGGAPCRPCWPTIKIDDANCHHPFAGRCRTGWRDAPRRLPRTPAQAGAGRAAAVGKRRQVAHPGRPPAKRRSRPRSAAATPAGDPPRAARTPPPRPTARTSADAPRCQGDPVQEAKNNDAAVIDATADRPPTIPIPSSRPSMTNPFPTSNCASAWSCTWR